VHPKYTLLLSLLEILVCEQNFSGENKFAAIFCFAGYANLCHLPPEILCKIFTYIPVPELYNSVSIVCKSVHSLFENGLVWNSIFYLNFFNDGMKEIFSTEFLKLFKNCMHLTVDASLLQNCDVVGSFKRLKYLNIKGSSNGDICNDNYQKANALSIFLLVVYQT
jgi:hypothetical protein